MSGTWQNRRVIFRVGLLCALLLAVTACTTDTTPGTPAPASATMAQFLQADPCGFVDSNALGVLGELTVAGADSFTSSTACPFTGSQRRRTATNPRPPCRVW